MPPKQPRSKKLDVSFLLNDTSIPPILPQPTVNNPAPAQPLPHPTHSIPASSSRAIPVPAGSGSHGSEKSESNSPDRSSSSPHPQRSIGSTKTRPAGRRVRVPTEHCRCSICGHLFTQVGDLTKHIRYVSIEVYSFSLV